MTGVPRAGGSALAHSAAPPPRPGAWAEDDRRNLADHGLVLRFEKARVAYHEKAASATGNAKGH